MVCITKCWYYFDTLSLFDTLFNALFDASLSLFALSLFNATVFILFDTLSLLDALFDTSLSLFGAIYDNAVGASIVGSRAVVGASFFFIKASIVRGFGASVFFLRVFGVSIFVFDVVLLVLVDTPIDGASAVMSAFFIFFLVCCLNTGFVNTSIVGLLFV